MNTWTVYHGVLECTGTGIDTCGCVRTRGARVRLLQYVYRYRYSSTLEYTCTGTDGLDHGTMVEHVRAAAARTGTGTNK